MTPCLDEEAVLSFCCGTMPAAMRAAAFEHISECDDCRALVSAVAQSSVVKSSDPATAATTPAEGLGDSRRPPPPSMSSPVQTGDLLAGKYRVERVLGAGGMGVVVAARHTQLDQLVALKFLLPSACEAPGAIDRFLREGKAAARIMSEHVARVVDTGVLDDGAPYLVMEYLEGTDLAALTANGGPLPASTAIDYVLQACEAIVEAHQLGIVHRDLKPANIFLSQRKDGSALVKVLDFGISKSDGGSRSNLTSTSVLMGSPRYMSPEQMVSAKDVDQRTDIWALGVVLYELVAGKPVWQADTVQGLCALIATAPAPRLREHAPAAPAVLEDVIARCLAKSAAERIPTVADLALALAPIAAAQSQTSVDRILGVSKRLRPAAVAQPSVTIPPHSPRRIPIAILAAIGALVVGALGTTLVLELRPSRAKLQVASEMPAPAVSPIAKASPSLEPASEAPVASKESVPLAAEPTASSLAISPKKPARSSRPVAPTPRPEIAKVPPTVPAEPPRSPAADAPTRALSDRK